MSKVNINHQHYLNLMVELKMRMQRLQPEADLVSAGNGIYANEGVLLLERVALQIRKILELIAFSSLAANHERFAEMRPNFAQYWKAKKLLEHLRIENSMFWPIPLTHTVKEGVSHFEPLETSDYFTEADFNGLFDAASEVLHVLNPYAEQSAVNFGRTVSEWLARIRKLLEIHQISLSEYDSIIVFMHDWTNPPVQLVAATSTRRRHG